MTVLKVANVIDLEDEVDSSILEKIDPELLKKIRLLIIFNSSIYLTCESIQEYKNAR